MKKTHPSPSVSIRSPSTLTASFARRGNDSDESNAEGYPGYEVRTSFVRK